MRKYNIAIIGANGLVGRETIKILEERSFPINNLFLVSRNLSEDKFILFKKKKIYFKNLCEFKFSNVNLAIFSANKEISRKFSKKATKKGCIVIDNSSYFRNDNDIPLIIPEINLNSLKEFKKKLIISNPNCSTIQMLIALNPIYKSLGIKRINISTYQSVSGVGKKGIEELSKQIMNFLNFKKNKKIKKNLFFKKIAFNAIPKIGKFKKNLLTEEENKIVQETKKIWSDKKIKINPTCVRIPIFYGHSESLNIETIKDFSIYDVKHSIKKCPSIKLIENSDKEEYPTPQLAKGNNFVYVGRIRRDLSNPKSINLWVVCDNIRKGAALNSVQIAECLIKKKFL